MAPQVGLEPTTLRLTAECSAIELLRSGRAYLLTSIISLHRLSSGILSASTHDSLIAILLPYALVIPHHEASMSGDLRLYGLIFSFLLLAAVSKAADDSRSASTTQSGPPKVKQDSVVDTVQGHKIADPYRWMEDPASQETQAYVRDEMAYTRSILDPLPGRKQLQQRLTELLSIGTIGAPQVGGNFYFYTRREGTQNQPVLLVREGIHGKDRPLVDVNSMSSDGTVALDWWFPSDDGKSVAYGTSASGSEESTLHLIETATGKLLQDTIDRTRFASLAWKKDNSGFYYTRHPKKGEVPAGEEV